MRALAFLASLVLAAAVVSRFPPLLERLPHVVMTVIYALAGAALGLACAAAARLPRGDVGPLWMRVAFPPRLALALALSFCTTVIAQTLQWSLGPVDPAFTSPAPAAVKTMWFFMFTLGFSGVGMMAAPSTFLPTTDLLGSLLRRLPTPALAVVFAVVGAGAGTGFGVLVLWRPVQRLVTQWQAFTGTHRMLITGVVLALTVGPVLLPTRSTRTDD